MPSQPTVTLSTLPPAQPALPSVAPDKVIITVGDQKVTAADFDQIIDALPEQYRAIARGTGRSQFAENVVRILALAQEGQRRKLEQTAAYRAQTRFQSENVLANLAYAEITKNLKPDDVELRKYYDAHLAEYEEAHARHILIRVKGSPVPLKPGAQDLTEAEALAKAEALRKRIVAGEDFAKLAAADSDDTGSAARGGDLGTFHRGQMVPSFEQAVFAMKPGQVSQPVKTQYGYHLIQLESIGAKPFESVKADIERQLGPQQAQKAVEDLVSKTTVTLDPEFFPPKPAAK